MRPPSLETQRNDNEEIQRQESFREDGMKKKEHMRKKGHKKLNPKNKMWDKYYLVNYLEFGKTWEDVAREDHERAFSEDLPSGWDHQEVRIYFSFLLITF